MEKKEIKISLTTFIVGIIAIVLLVLCVGMGIYISTMNKNQTNIPSTANIQNKTSTIDENKAEELDVNSELVQKLYSYVIGTRRDYAILNAENLEELNKIIYTSEKSTVDTISNDTKLLTVIEKMCDIKEYTEKNANVFPPDYDENGNVINGLYIWQGTGKSYWYNYVTKKWEWKNSPNFEIHGSILTFDIKNIQKVAKEIFNEELEIGKRSYDFFGEELIYDNGEYKFISNEGGGATFLDYENKIIKAKKEDNNIYIYDNYIVDYPREIEIGYGTGRISELYTAFDKKKQIKSSNSNKEIDLMDLMSEKDDKTYELDPQKAEEYGITLPIYKHTFTKSESGNYYWVSTELTNY